VAGQRFVFAGGGTGGHLFPALAIAQEIKRKIPGSHICFVGTRGKIESRVVPEYGYEFRTLWISGVRRGRIFGNLLVPLKVSIAMVQAMSHLKNIGPDVVVGTGGYVSGPLLYSAAWLGIPTLIHEQNSVPGQTTLMLAKKVDEVHVSFDETKKRLPDGVRAVLSGNPTRRTLDGVERDGALEHFSMDPSDGRPVVLVSGGSLGARSINNAIAGNLDEVMAANVRLIWQTGRQDADRILGECGGRTGSSLWIGAFIEKMEFAYAACDLAVSGATTIAELTRLGKPAVLVPYPHAAADHQTLNARALEKTGAAAVVTDAEIGERIAAVIAETLRPGTLKKMSKASASLGKPDAAERIANRVIRLATKKGDS
jgi:UDP-N-acetylglucosamine--N-acetylmuramyl-(pentapeptide) pyrophosphoryl-undecaprenol N-acetylglucosamine transferase